MCSKTFFWNVRGLNDSDKFKPFSQWLNTHQPLFGAILETHIKEQNLNHVMSQVCQGWQFTSNHHSDEDGRIILIWKHPVTLLVLDQSRQSLTCEISVGSSLRFVYTAIYASNLSQERTDLWVELINLQDKLSLHSSPWIVGGDFNQIVHPEEHSQSAVNSFTPAMIEFRDTLLQLGLFDLRFQGLFNTWSNKQPTNPIAKKLDRLLVNQCWISYLPNSAAFFLAPEFSDHCPCLLDLSIRLPHAGTKPFKFFNFLTKHPKFYPTVEETWIQAGGYATNLTQLCWKLKNLKGALRTLNKDNFSNIQERVSATNCLLQAVQVHALQHPSESLFEQERSLHLEWTFLRTIEEAFFRQKSRINWLNEGDHNTFFSTELSKLELL